MVLVVIATASPAEAACYWLQIENFSRRINLQFHLKSADGIGEGYIELYLQ